MYGVQVFLASPFLLRWKTHQPRLTASPKVTRRQQLTAHPNSCTRTSGLIVVTRSKTNQLLLGPKTKKETMDSRDVGAIGR